LFVCVFVGQQCFLTFLFAFSLGTSVFFRFILTFETFSIHAPHGFEFFSFCSSDGFLRFNFCHFFERIWVFVAKNWFFRHFSKFSNGVFCTVFSSSSNLVETRCMYVNFSDAFKNLGSIRFLNFEAPTTP